VVFKDTGLKAFQETAFTTAYAYLIHWSGLWSASEKIPDWSGIFLWSQKTD
jgi:hypothetical protein